MRIAININSSKKANSYHIAPNQFSSVAHSTKLPSMIARKPVIATSLASAYRVINTSGRVNMK